MSINKKFPWVWAIIAAELLVVVGIVGWGLQGKSDKPTPAMVQPNIISVLTSKGLSSPTAIVATKQKDDPRLFVLEQAGLVRIIKEDKTLAAEPFLDIQPEVKNEGEMGLLGMAFHPKFATNGYFFVNYVDKDQNTIVARYQVDSQNPGSAAKADPTSKKVILKVAQPYGNHKGGTLQFGPDGYLYIGMGDGGSGGDPENRAQDRTSLLGKILRIDIDQGDPYSVPADNPFASEASTKPEIWALGLRNPWKFSFDSASGDLYIADVGQGSWEEINVQKAAKGGLNYGWRCYEGTTAFNTIGCQAAETYTAPVITYDHLDHRCSVTGGYVYRGTKYPALDGLYFYGDYCGGQMYYAQEKEGTWRQTLTLGGPHQFSTFGQGNDGELYFADYATGNIYTIVDTAN